MLINILVWVILLGLLYWLVLQLPLPHPFKLVAQIVFILIAIFVVLGLLGLGGVTVPPIYKG